MTTKSFNPMVVFSVGFLVCWWTAICAVLASAEDNRPLINAIVENFDETGRKLPPGVPKVVDTNGVLEFIDRHFTTPAYQNEALQLVVQEANQVARSLKLSEQLPIVQSNLIEYHISPFGFAYGNKMIGFVATKNYIYYVTCDNKFNNVGIANYDETCFKLRKQLLPIKQLDTNAAYQFATQWLAAASMDVPGLNRDCNVKIEVNKFWNENSFGSKLNKSSFVPIYDVSWLSPEDLANGGDTAFVELVVPEKTLLQLVVSKPEYILRGPIKFTNLATLFPGVATIHTNYQVKTIYMDASRWGTN